MRGAGSVRGVLCSWGGVRARGGQCAWGAAFLGWAAFGGAVWGRLGDVRMWIIPASRESRAWFPNNVARNSHVNLSNMQMGSLKLQRLWTVLKTDRGELRATFLGERVRCGGRGQGWCGHRGRNARFVW